MLQSCLLRPQAPSALIHVHLHARARNLQLGKVAYVDGEAADERVG